MEQEPNTPGTSSEEFDGCPLSELCGAPMAVEQFLPLALQITAALAEIHRQHLMHRRLQPHNIIVNPVTGEVRITDFSFASSLSQEFPGLSAAPLGEGALAYMSPEQTGRMNRLVDYRTDLYSLGVVFYEMLTGQLPFQGSDPLEWVHCHVARLPQPPAEVVPELPVVLSDIVMRLLAKMTEDRYQSAHGLRCDLAECLRQLDSTGQIAPFKLGTHDVSERFQIPQKLYGREAQVAILLGTFDLVAASGQPELVLVSGYSGIGKSSLVYELHKPIVRERGYFISGKFDQYKRDIPYATFTEAFRTLVQQTLALSEERIAVWKQNLQEALGSNGQLIVDVIPQVELIIGPQPSVPELPPIEAQNRFHMVFHRFIEVFARAAHPLVIFLDDLQWADAASLHLIKHLLLHHETRYLLLVGAYRNNELNASHPLTLTLEEISKTVSPLEIKLGPLSEVSLRQLVADTLHCELAAASSLVALILSKTAGNPFFVNQFLQTLYQGELISFDPASRCWRWDIERIREANVTDNVVDLMAHQIRQLAPSTREALQLAASLGNQFDLDTLAAITARSVSQLANHLGPAVSQGLLLASNGTGEGAISPHAPLRVIHSRYRWLHDRVQQAAYQLVSEDERAEAHLRIGRLLLARTPADDVDEHIFEIVNQFNHGTQWISDQLERERVAQLNLQAGQRAKASTAYASANSYFAAGLALLPTDSWTTHYELTYALTVGRAECAYLNGEFDEAEKLCQRALAYASTNADKVKVYLLKIDLYTTTGQYASAIASGVECLSLLGIEISSSPSSEQALAEEQLVWKNLGERQIEDLINLPPMTNPDMCAALDVLSVMHPSASYLDPQLFFLIPSCMTNISLVYGNAPASAMGYVTFGNFVCLQFGKPQEGYRFGRLACELVERTQSFAYRSKIYFVMGVGTSSYLQPFTSSIEYLDRCSHVALEIGDLNFACYATFLKAMYVFIRGNNLNDAYQASEKCLDLARRVKFKLIADCIIGQRQLIQTLRGQTVNFGSFDDQQFSEEEFEAGLSEFFINLSFCLYQFNRLEARFHSHDYTAALAAANQVEEHEWSLFSLPILPEYYCYRALTLAAVYSESAPEQRESYMAQLLSCQQKLREWAESYPRSFGTQYALASAEIARLSGSVLEAEHLYEQAIESARGNRLLQKEGLACELTAGFYRGRGFDSFADSYLREARDCYLRWGAAGQVNQLDQLHPQLLAPQAALPARTLPVGAEQLDALAVVKASQAISGQIFLDQLLDTLMRVMIENAGAQRGSLLFVRGDQLQLAAEARVERQHINVRTYNEQGLSELLLPSSILNYVRRSRERVILDDATEPNPFSADNYLVRQRPKSVLCLPILRQAEPVGLLYLENNLATRAFTSDRLAVLELLAAQAAISLENARLYTDLQQENSERKQAEEALRQSETMLRSLFESAPDAVLLVDESGRMVRVNAQAEQLFGYTRDELLGQTIETLIPERFGPGQMEHRGASLLEPHTRQMGVGQKLFGKRKDGSEFPVDIMLSPMDSKEGNMVIAVARDITERQRAEEALLASEKRFSVAFNSSPSALFISTFKEGRYLDVNETALQISGYTREEVIGRTAAELNVWANPREREEFTRMISEQGEVRDYEAKLYVKDGELRLFSLSVAIIEIEGQRCLLSAASDITDRKRAEEELRRYAEEISSLYNNAPCGYHSIDADGTFIRVNDTELNWLGYPREEVVGKIKLSDIVTPESLEIFLAGFPRLKEQGWVHDIEFEMIRKDGTIMPVLLNATAIRDEAGNFVMTNSTLFDITERKKLEEQLWLSQKMEAVGRLAGGVAHDFNNLLTAILGYSQLALSQIGPDEHLHLQIKEIKRAGERAAALTSQLLAFSRRQILQPKILNLNFVVADIDKLLRRLIGEDIELLTVLEPTLGQVKADPGQIEQVIMNLAVNARDAMPHGGKLTIETANVELDEEYARNHLALPPGAYVMLAVSDTGQGIDEASKQHIFEPFFTTKEKGKGTGLGLSTVYGIVKQSGGYIWVYSEVGQGTSFKVYLPRSEAAADVMDGAGAQTELVTGKETILLVEDEEMVRRLASEILKTSGYTVLEASGGREAMLLCEQHKGTIHLMITDVVMPRMSGRELAERLATLRPDMKVLFMSGYTDNAIVHHGVLNAGTEFIQKPFSPDDLLAKAQDVLHRNRDKGNEKRRER